MTRFTKSIPLRVKLVTNVELYLEHDEKVSLFQKLVFSKIFDFFSNLFCPDKNHITKIKNKEKASLTKNYFETK